MSEDTGSIVPLIWKDLYERYEELKQVGDWFKYQPRVVLVGEVTAGPRVLYETLFGPPAGSGAHTSSDGVAWEVVANYSLAEAPGAGQVGARGDEELALSYLRETDAAVLVVPADRLPSRTEQGIYDHIRRLKRAHLLVAYEPLEPGATPPRRVPAPDEREWAAWVSETQRVLDNSDLECVLLRRLYQRELSELARKLHDALAAKYRLSLIAGIRHRPTRDALIAKIINDLSRTAAFLGLSPIPYSDTIAITPIQVLLVCRVAGAHGRRIAPGWAADFVATCLAVAGVGLGFRALFRKLISGISTPSMPVRMTLGAAVAFGGTQLVGHAARLYFANEGRLSVRQAASEAMTLVPGAGLAGWGR